MTLEEQERAAYMAGDTTKADLLLRLISAEEMIERLEEEVFDLLGDRDDDDI